MKTKQYLLAVTLFALPIAASAADLPVKARPFVPVPVSDWSGVYVGGEAGYGWGKQTSDAIDPGLCFEFETDPLHCRTFGSGFPVVFPDVSINSIKQKGWLAGAFFGAQKQWGSWVLGIEANVDGANIKGSAFTSVTNVFDVPFGSGVFITNHTLAATSTVDMLGSVRGKVGFVPAPAWMLYGTGGLAFAHVKNSAIDVSSFIGPTEGIGAGIFGGGSVSGATSLFGWVAGAGVDYKIMQDAGSSWVFGVEYLHYQFDSNTFTLNDGFGLTTSFNGKQSVDTVVGRISYLFAIH
jgi:outer membrane immunogenic protein